MSRVVTVRFFRRDCFLAGPTFFWKRPVRNAELGSGHLNANGEVLYRRFVRRVLGGCVFVHIRISWCCKELAQICYLTFEVCGPYILRQVVGRDKECADCAYPQEQSSMTQHHRYGMWLSYQCAQSSRLVADLYLHEIGR